jgi:flagellar hook-associated protein 1 FlgK
LDGFDLTPVVSSGKMGGLIDLRDDLLVSEQAKFDAFSAVMIREVNRVSNQGASFPARTTLLGDVIGVAAGDALAATGNFRIATLDASGVVVNTADFNLAGYATVGAMIADINAVLGPDVTASVAAPDGRLQIVANNAGEGVAMNELTSDVGPDNLGVSHYFGLNNLFDGTGADDVVVSQYLLDNPEFLAAGSLSPVGGLAVGDSGVAPGDSSITNDLRDALTGNHTFNAAGNFAAQTESVDKYMDKIISDAAFSAKNSAYMVIISQSLMNETKSTLENLSGVNIDEEMAHLIDLEAKYEASATMLATIQELFDTLLSAVR